MICGTGFVPLRISRDPRPLYLHLAAFADRARASLKRRGPAVLFALAIEALIILLFLTLVGPLNIKEKERPLVFTFDAEGGDDAATETEKKMETRLRSGGGDKSANVPQPVQPQPEPMPEPPVEWPSTVRWMSRSDYQSTDIKAIRGTAPPGDAQAPGTGGPMRGDSELAMGRGPGGEKLYAAQWYVEPTDAQLRTYLAGRPPGWGTIACKTAPNYRVEDCVELADFPRGSRLAGAIREAAWQFRVRPPRVGGKPMIGEWVAIRITYSERGEKGPGPHEGRREPSDPEERSEPN